MEKIEFEPIGRCHTCYKEKFGIPRQSGLVPSSQGKIKLQKQFAREEALRGLKSFSHLIIYFFAHKVKTSRSLSVRPPRLGGNEKVGCFASRSPFRPNAICHSIVKLEDIKEDVIYFSNHDILDGSPVLDIKPYIPEWDIFNDASNGWLAKTSDPKIVTVRFATDSSTPDNLKPLLTEVLSLDPTPRSHPKAEYTFFIDEYEVKIEYLNEVIVVKNAKKLGHPPAPYTR